MKILIIDDSTSIVEDVKKALSTINAKLISFKPDTFVFKDLVKQLVNLCIEESFDIALVDSKLWANITGDMLIPVFKEYKIPFIAFSHNDDFNFSLGIRLGAIGYISKHLVYGRRGFSNYIFLNKFNSIIRQ